MPSVDDEAPTAQPGDRVGGWPLDPPVDTGATEGARGQTIDDDGTLVGYIVARDDNIEAIARRFDLEYAYLVVINGARRNVGLYEDDVINLDAHYIMSLGTENGKALSLTPPDPLPPQQPAPDGY